MKWAVEVSAREFEMLYFVAKALGWGKFQSSRNRLVWGLLGFLGIEINYKELDVSLSRRIPSANVLRQP